MFNFADRQLPWPGIFFSFLGGPFQLTKCRTLNSSPPAPRIQHLLNLSLLHFQLSVAVAAFLDYADIDAPLIPQEDCTLF
jgi:hypothetical protein